MAKLQASSATIEIVLHKRETVTSNWVDTEIVLEYHIQEQHVMFRFPSKNISLSVEDYETLIGGARQYINTLPVQPVTSANRLLDEFHFMPIEPSFELQLSSGFYFDERRHDGQIYVDIKVSLRTLGVKELAGDGIGCSLEVRIEELLFFINCLEQEVNTLLAR